MKDLLDRDIMVGDKLAYPNQQGNICICKVVETASFALNVEDSNGIHWVVSDPKLRQYVICDWAKGSDAAK
jgi:hypothetical protein